MTYVVYKATGGSWQGLTSPPPPATGSKGLVGAYVKTVTFGAASQEAANADWVALTGRPLVIRRVYFPLGQIPATLAASGMGPDAAAGRKVAVSFRPAFSPQSPTDFAALDGLLADCKAGGLKADVSLYQEAFGVGMTAAQCIAATRYYAPAVRAHYPLVFDTSSFAVQHSNENSFYAGDDVIDKVATDFYCSEYLGGVRLDLAASLADAASPRKPFGLWEFNASRDPSAGQTQAQTIAYAAYITSFFTARLAAGKPNGDLLIFNSGTVLSQETEIKVPGDYRITDLYQPLYDALSAGG